MVEEVVERDAPAQLATACERVGRFLYHFAFLEQAIGEGVAKLLKLDSIQTKVVMANLDFTRKVNILFSAESEAAAKPKSTRKRQVENARKAILRINDWRVVLAHSPFKYSTGDAVIFDRFTAREKLVNKGEVWGTADFEDRYALISETVTAVERLVAEMEPYSPSLDFSDPRNSWLLAVI
jgi:hypothetical protein